MGDSSKDQQLSDYLPQKQWNIAIELLQLLQSDYQQARLKLEEICGAFGKREAVAGERLQSALKVIKQPGSQRASHGKPVYLRVYCLGSFEVYLGLKKIDNWHSLKAKSLLKYLVAQHGQPTTKDVLIETLWPDSAPDLANNNLKVTMHALRQTLNPLSDGGHNFPYVLIRDGNYLINPKVDMWVDVEDFEHHWMTGRRLEKKGKLAEAIREYELAEGLYRGNYLEDDPYEEWMLLRREALKDIYFSALSKLADHSMETADYDSCIVYCQKILARDSCREDAYRRLMQSHSRLGQRNRALQWYELCQSTIKTELDIAPDRQTSALHHKLLNDERI
jgi:DNA-binding SARP family transcriptional activator